MNNDTDELKGLSHVKKEIAPEAVRQVQGHYDVLIIGQGISGTWLSYYLQKEGKSFLVVDDPAAASSSKIAAGIINPITGRRYAETWMAKDILPFVHAACSQLGRELGINAISQKNIIDFFPSPQMRLHFLQRIEEKDEYVHSYPEQNQFNHLFQYDFGCGEVRPVHIVHLETILPAWRHQLKERNSLLEEYFDIGQLQLASDGIRYKDITADKIIFCDGNHGAANPFFTQLPFAPNKGELLIVEIPDLPPQHIYKKGMMLVPLSDPGSWWVGSDYKWEFADPSPTKEFKEKTERFLKSWLKMSFKITAHLAGVRPATLERRPFVGLHPLHPAIGILNGMGTKGCSLAPFFAKQLVDHLYYHMPLTPEAGIERFAKTLAR